MSLDFLSTRIDASSGTSEFRWGTLWGIPIEFRKISRIAQTFAATKEERHIVRIGVLELLAPVRGSGWKQSVENYLTTKQYFSIMPQAIAVWCRQLGHQVFYATYYGRGDPKKQLPDELDVVFIACTTRFSALSYALAKLYRQEKTLTVIGGPHAKSFPHDCQRFFDLVVTSCDRDLITDILSGGCEPKSIISSGRILTDLPSVEERIPEIRDASFSRGKRPYFATMVPLLASVGCPYTCNFCTDWNNPYVVLPPDHLEADLRYVSQKLPEVKIAFHDPNFAVKFDETLDVLERIPPEKRNPYIVESSLSVLRGSRLQRLRDTNCLYIAPGIESWSSYSNKAGVGTKTGSEKVRLVVDHLELLHSYVPGIQVNFIFGLDTDEGDEPVELTKEFMTGTPFVWPIINIPVPFGGTPLYNQYLRENRILSSMPFPFYYLPYLVTTLKHYDPITYYQMLIDMLLHYSNSQMLWWRLRTTPNWGLRLLSVVRTFRVKEAVGQFQQILRMLIRDPQFLAFHEGRSTELPEFYHREYERLLGPYATLLSRADRTPELVPMSTIPKMAPVIASVGDD